MLSVTARFVLLAAVFLFSGSLHADASGRPAGRNVKKDEGPPSVEVDLGVLDAMGVPSPNPPVPKFSIPKFKPKKIEVPKVAAPTRAPYEIEPSAGAAALPETYLPIEAYSPPVMFGHQPQQQIGASDDSRYDEDQELTDTVFMRTPERKPEDIEIIAAARKLAAAKSPAREAGGSGRNRKSDQIDYSRYDKVIDPGFSTAVSKKAGGAVAGFTTRKASPSAAVPVTAVQVEILESQLADISAEDILASIEGRNIHNEYKKKEAALAAPSAPAAPVVPAKAVSKSDAGEKIRREAAPAPSPASVSGPLKSEISIIYQRNAIVLDEAMKRQLQSDVLPQALGGAKVEIRAYASKTANGEAASRRLSLARALELQEYLEGHKVSGANINIIPMGDKDDKAPGQAATDRVDIYILGASNR